MRINVELTANTGSFETDFKRAAKAAEKRAKEIERAFINVGKVIGTGIGIGVTALGALVKKSIDAAAELDDLSQKTGIAVESLSRLQYAAGLEGVEDLGASLAKLAKTISSDAELFKILGINVTQANGSLRTTEDVLLDLADLFSKSADGTRKAAIAQELFGKSGAALIPLLNKGSAGIKELYEEADRLGITISGKTSKAADDFNNNIYKLQGAVSGFANRLAENLAPELARLTSLFVQTTKDANGMASTASALSDAFKTIALGAIAAGNAVQILIRAFIAGHLAQKEFLSGNFSRAWDELGAGSQAIMGDVNDVKNAYSALFDEIEKGAAKVEKGGDGILPDVEAMKKAAEEAAKARKKATEDAQKDAEKALKDAMDAEEKQRESIRDTIDALKEESATIGLTNAQLAARKIEILGGTEAEKLQAYELAQYIDLQNKSAAATKAMSEATRADTIALEESARAYQRQIDDFGKGPSARRFSAGQNEIDDEFRSRVQSLQSDSAAGLLPPGVYEQELSRLEEFHGKASRQWRDYYGQIEEKNSDFSAGIQESLQSYVDSYENLGVMITDGFLGVMDQASASVSDLTAKFILWGEGGKAAVSQIAGSIAEGLLTNLIDVGIQYLKNAAIQKFAITSTTAAGVAASQTSAAAQAAANSTIAASAAPAAAATSLATFGANMGPAIAAILATAAAAAIFTNGFAEGGYTGNNSTSSVAGVVHGQEFVANAQATRKYRALLEQMNAGVPLNLPETGSPYLANMERGGGQAAPQNIRIVNAFDGAVVGDYLQTSDGEKLLDNYVRRNGAKIRNVLNG